MAEIDSKEENDVTPNSLVNKPGCVLPMADAGSGVNSGGMSGSKVTVLVVFPELIAGQPRPPVYGPCVSTLHTLGAARTGSGVLGGHTLCIHCPTPHAATGNPKPSGVHAPGVYLATVHPGVLSHKRPQALMFGTGKLEWLFIKPSAKPM